MDSSTHLTSAHPHRGRWLALITALAERVHDRFTPAISERDFALKPGSTDDSLAKALDFVAVCSRPRA